MYPCGIQRCPVHSRTDSNEVLEIRKSLDGEDKSRLVTQLSSGPLAIPKRLTDLFVDLDPREVVKVDKVPAWLGDYSPSRGVLRRIPDGFKDRDRPTRAPILRFVLVNGRLKKTEEQADGVVEAWLNAYYPAGSTIPRLPESPTVDPASYPKRPGRMDWGDLKDREGIKGDPSWTEETFHLEMEDAGFKPDPLGCYRILDVWTMLTKHMGWLIYYEAWAYVRNRHDRSFDGIQNIGWFTDKGKLVANADTLEDCDGDPYRGEWLVYRPKANQLKA